MNKSIPNKVVDLFAGGGGLSIGFLDAGFHIVAAFDNWAPAVEFYSQNISTHPIYHADLTDYSVVNKINSIGPEMIIGGPPCQDFSSAGKRHESEHANLTVVFAKIVTRIKPQFFLMENVERAIRSTAFRTASNCLSEAGYGLTTSKLDASLCGVPQRRKRLFLFGELGGHDDCLQPFLTDGQSKNPLTVREYFGNKLDFEYYYRHPRSYARRGIFSIDEPSPTIRGVNRPIPNGYPGHKGDPVPVTSDLRPLTTKERSMIQTFPESFEFSGRKSDLEQIIGNAVPVKLAEFVANKIKAYILS